MFVVEVKGAAHPNMYIKQLRLLWNVFFLPLRHKGTKLHQEYVTKYKLFVIPIAPDSYRDGIGVLVSLWHCIFYDFSERTKQLKFDKYQKQIFMA